MKYIDLEHIIKESDSSFLKKLPDFIIRILIKIIRQEEINEIINRNAEFSGVDFLVRILKEFNLRLETDGLENLPESSKCFIVANHPFGIIDGLILTNLAGRKYGSLKAIGNDAYMLVPNLRPVVAAVNVFGRNPKDYITALEELYKSDTPITHFPSGEVSRVHRGKVQDCEWQKSFIGKAISCNRLIVPIFFFGRNSNLFYATGIIRKLLGIKMNLEIVLLPWEMMRKRNKTIRLRIGKPISPLKFDKTMTQREWAQWVREQVYALGRDKH